MDNIFRHNVVAKRQHSTCALLLPVTLSPSISSSSRYFFETKTNDVHDGTKDIAEHGFYNVFGAFSADLGFLAKKRHCTRHASLVECSTCAVLGMHACELSLHPCPTEATWRPFHDNPHMFSSFVVAAPCAINHLYLQHAHTRPLLPHSTTTIGCRQSF